MKNFVSVQDVQDINGLVKIALDYKTNPLKHKSLGTNKRIGLLFLNPSMRTRLSTQIAATEFYQDHPFTHVSGDSIFLKQVVNTNKCVIQLEKVGTKLVVHSIIDNLLKGASGQAVQNMNLMFGLDECAGLKLKANFF